MADANGNLLLARFAGNPAASPEEIEKVQQSLNLWLPKSYVDLMLTRDGGDPRSRSGILWAGCEL